MKKFLMLFVGAFLFVCTQSNAQSPQAKAAATPFVPTPHVYYMYISGIKTGDDVAALESLVQQKSGVTYFLGNRFPCRYFLLKSMPAVSQDEFASWIGNKYKIEFYGYGEQAREGALLVYLKHQKK